MAASLTPLVPVAASRKGACDGFETRCSCGTVIRRTFRTMAEAEAAQHLAWHQKRGQ